MYARLSRIVVIGAIAFVGFGPGTACGINIILESFTNSTHPLILNGTANDNGVPLAEEPPSYDSDSSGLLNVLQHVEIVYQDAFEDPFTVRITYLWDTNTAPFSGQSNPPWVVEDPNTGQITHAIVRFNPARNWFIDPTPSDDSEFTMSQTLYNFGPNALTLAEQTTQYSGTVPNTFEAGHQGPAVTGGPADQDMFGNNLRDLLTVAFHEVLHSIGISSGYPGNIVTDMMGNPVSGEAADGDWDINPTLVGGATMAVLAPGTGGNGPFAHFVGDDSVLSTNLASVRMRTRPSATDFLATAAVQGWTTIDLPRQDFLVGNDWAVPGNWMGNQVPDSNDDAFVRHGGSVDLSGDVDIRNLVVDAQSNVSTSIHTLDVFDTTTVGGTAGGVSELTIFPLGDLQTNVLEINDEGRTRVDFGGLAEASTLNINDGGELWLVGTPSGAAVVDGIITHVNSGGLLRVTGNSQVDSQLALHSMGVIDVQDPGAELRLNWFTGLDGGTMQGPGVVRQNGNLFVTDDTTISVDTYDMDGSAENTVITINLGNTLDIDSPHIDTVVNLFHGEINVNGGMLDIEAGWTLVGDLNLTQTDGAGAALLGAGGMTIHGSGQLNVTGFAGIGTDVTVAGTVFADGDANFNGKTSILSTADLETNGANDEIDFNGLVTLAGGSYTGAGVIKFDSQVLVTANTTIGMSQADLDGDTGGVVLTIRPSVTFSVASSTIDPIDDAFDAVMNLEGTFSTIVPFVLDGTLNTIKSPSDPPPTLNGLTDFTVSASGIVNTDGNAVINRDTIVQGTLKVGAGVTQVNGEATFESTAVVTVAAGGELELNGPTTFEGGSYSGGGLIQFNGTTNINDDTTISTARVDLDGAAENTVLNLNDSQLTLNIDLVDTTSVQYNGLANVVGENAQFAVNLNGPSNAWRLMSDGQLNFSNPSPTSPTVTMLSGSGLSAEGVINAVGPLILAADVEVKNLLNANTAQTHVHFGGPTRSTIHTNPTATVVGLGQITVDEDTTLNLEDQSQVAVDTTNRGRLEIGFEASEVSVDYTVPATATVRGFFAQTIRAEFAVDLGGTTQATEYDWLQVIGMARLSGTVEATFIDDFVPDVGTIFTILTATDGRDGEFDNVAAIDENDVLGFVLTDLYTATEAMLRVDDVFLIGDYNDDGTVNAADYVMWRKNEGTTNVLPNDPIGGMIGQSHYDQWQAHFGNTLAGSGSLAGAAVPEPASLLLWLPAIALLLDEAIKRIHRNESVSRLFR